MTSCSRQLVILLCVSLLSLFACSFKSSDSESQAQRSSTFHVGPLSTVDVTPLASDPVWGLKVRKEFRLRTSVVDRGTTTKLTGERFVLWKGEEAQEVEVDPDGNISWSEVISYVPLAMESCLLFQRRLEGRSGSEVIRFALNPWLEPGGLIDLRDRILEQIPCLVPEEETALALAGRQQYRPQANPAYAGKTNLIVKKVDIEVGPPTAPDKRNFRASFSVEAERVKKDGGTTSVPLPSGRFHLRIQLVQSQTNGARRGNEVWATYTKDVNLAAGVITVSEDLPIEGNADVALAQYAHYTLEPLDDAVVGLMPAKGELPLKGTVGTSSGTPNPLPPDFLLPLTADPRGKAKRYSFLVRRPRFTPGPKREFNNERWVSTVKVVTDICPVDPDTRAPLYGVTLQAALAETSDDRSADFEVLRPTDPVEGCTTFEGNLHYPHDHRAYLDRYLLVKSEDPNFTGTVNAFPISFYPWEDGPQFAIDRQKNTVPELPTDRVTLTDAEQDTSITYRNSLHKITRFLQLVTLRRYEATLPLRLGIPSVYEVKVAPGTDEQKGDLPKVPVGAKVRVRGLLLHPLYLDRLALGHATSRPVIAGFETSAVVSANSKIHFPVGLAIEFSRQSLIDSRTSLMVEVTPEGVAPDKLPAPGIFMGTFKSVASSTSSGSCDLRESKFGQTHFQELWEKGKSESASFPYAFAGMSGTSFGSFTQWPEAPIDMLIRYYSRWVKIQRIEMAEKPERDGWQAFAVGKPGAFTNIQLWFEGKLSKSEGTPDKFLAPFCGTLSAASRTRCSQNPGRYFHAASFKIIDDVLPEQQLQPGIVNIPTFSVQATFFHEFMFSQRFVDGVRHIREYAEGWTGKVGADMNGNGVTYSSGLVNQDETFDAKEGFVAEDRRNRYQMSETFNLSGEEKHFQFQAKNSRCLLVRPLDSALDTRVDGNAFLYCTTPRVSTISEVWVHIWDQWRQLTSSHIDPGDFWQKGIAKVVRGLLNYQMWKTKLTAGVSFFLMKKVEPYVKGTDTLAEAAFPTRVARFQEDGGQFTGMNDYREMSPFLWNEHEIERSVDICEGRKPRTSPTEESEPAEPDPSLDTPENKEARARWEFRSRMCRCYFENVARSVSRQTYIGHRKDWDDYLKKQQVEDHCQKVVERAQEAG